MTSFLQPKFFNNLRLQKKLGTIDDKNTVDANKVSNQKEASETEVVQIESKYVRFVTNYKPIHRGGWADIVNAMDSKLDFHKENKRVFYDILEMEFRVKPGKVQTQQWIGILHILQYKNPTDCIFSNPNFIKSLRTCKGLITLAPNLRDYALKKVKEYNYNIPVYLIKHPILFSDVPLFSFEKYAQNLNKYIIQIGQQDRKISSLGIINSPGHTKLWLTGIKEMKEAQQRLNFEKREMGRVFPPFKMLYTNTFDEYDAFLSENVVFLDFHVAVANNTVVECILRNTPLILNKTESLIYYLGKDYPLFYTKLDEVPDLLSLEKILEANIYLKNMDKTDITI